jgi:hypothetical protein
MIIHLQKNAKFELIGMDTLAIYYRNLYNIIKENTFVIVSIMIITKTVLIYYA